MKKIYTLIIGFLVLCGLNAQAQWTQTNGPYTNSTVVSLATDGTNLFAGTQNSGIYLSTDFGVSWILKAQGLDYFSVHTILINGTNMYAATEDGLYSSSNNGTSWTNRLGGGFYSSSSIVINGTTLIAANNGGIFRSTNGGLNWTSVSGVLLNATLGVSGSNFIAATSSGVYKSTDDGLTWNQVNAIQTTIKALKANGTNVFAGTTSGGVLLSTDNGATWVAKNTGLPASSSVTSFAINGTDLYIGTGSGVYKSSDSGNNWTTANTGITATTVNSIAIIGADVYVGTVNTGVYLSSDFGVSWAQSNNGLVTSDVRALGLSGSNLFAGTNGTGIYLTGSSGANWNGANVGLTNQTVSSVVVNGINTFAGTNGGGVFLSTNNGASWTQVNGGSELTNLDVVSLVTIGSNLFAGTNGGGVFLSTNNGTSWTAVNTGLTRLTITALTANGTNLFAGTDNSGVFFSSNNGTSWTAVNTGLPLHWIYSLTSKGSTVFVLDDVNSAIYSTTNNGASWTPTAVPTNSTYSIVANGSNLFAFGRGISISTNNGATWSNISNGLPAQVSYGFSVSGNTVFIGTIGLGVWKRNLDEILCSVNPPVMSSALTATICSGDSVNLSFTNTGVAANYSWIASDNLQTGGESTTSQSTSILNNVITNTSNLTASNVLYTVTPKGISGGCSGTPQTVTVTVNPLPVMTSNSNLTICSGQSVGLTLTGSVPSSFTWIAANNANTTGESITLKTTSTINDVITNSSLVPQIVTYTVTPKASVGSCGGTPQTVTVTVNPLPTMTSASSATICSGGTVNINLTSSVQSNYTWIAADNANTTGESTSFQSPSTLSNTIVNTTTTAQQVTYTVTPTAVVGGCAGTQTVTVTVNPAPTMTSAATSTICSGSVASISLTSNIASSYVWYAASDNPNTTGESLNPQSTATLSNTITNNSTIAQIVYYNVTPTSSSGSCAGTTQSVAVTVNPLPTMSSSGSASICSGGAVSIVLGANIASSFTWIAVDNLNTTGESTTSQSTSTLSNTITNTSTAVQSDVYTVTPTASLGGCTGTAQTVTVSVNPKPTMSSATTATICSGGTVNIPLTSVVASSYSWIAADNANTTGESTSLQSTNTLNNTIINNSSTPQNVVYTITPTGTSGSCAGTSQTVTVTVNPTPVMTSVTTGNGCSGGTINISFASNIASSYSWIATDNPNTTGESTTAQSTGTLSNTITNNSTLVQNVFYTVTPTSTVGSCVGVSQTVTAVVNPVPTISSSSSATICSGSSVSIPFSSNVSSNYSWVAADNANTVGESTTSQSSSTLNNTITNNSTAAQNVVYTVTPTAALGGCSGTPQTVTVSVNPLPAMTSATTATICSGGTVTIPLTSNVASSYSWIATNNVNTTGESVTAQSSSSLTNTIINNSSAAQNITYSVVPTSTSGGCTGASQTVTVTVNPAPSITNATSATICSGGTVNIPLSSNVSSSFTWIATDNANTTGESTSLQSTNILNNTITNNTSIIQTISYAVTPTSTLGSCGGASQTVTVTVNPAPSITNATSATICSGGTVSISLSSNVSSSFSWIAADNANTTGESTTSQSSSTLNNTITNNSAAAQNVVYTVTPTAALGGCSGTPQTVTVFVNPLPAMTSATTATICSGGTVAIPLTSNVASSYSWIATNNVNTTGESVTTQSSSSLTNTIINNSSAAQNITYSVIPTSTSGGCAGASQTVTVTVNPAPSITNATSATICSGGTVNIPLSSNVSSSFTWIATDNANTTGESTLLQSTNTLNNTITNNTSIIQTISYAVTPTSTLGSCGGASQTVTVTVNPAPSITNATSATICSGGAVSISLSSDVSSSFSWIAADNTNTTGESITSQLNNILNNTLTNNSNVLQNVIYSVTPTTTFGGCMGTAQTITVTVSPIPVMTNVTADTICSGGTVNISLTSSTPSSYLWSAVNNLNTTGESTTTQSSGTLNNTILNTSSVAQNVIYTVTPTSLSGGCVGTSQTVTVTVNPEPLLISSSTVTICSGGTVTMSLIGNVNSTFSWVAADNLHTTGESTTVQSGDTLVNTIVNSSSFVQNVIYTVIPTSVSGGCVGGGQTISMLVNPLDNANFSYPASTYCQSGNDPNALITGLTGGSFSSTAGLVFSNLNNGLVNLGASALGSYVVTYTTNSACSNSSTFNLTITNAPSASFSYAGTPYCSSVSNPIPVFANGSSAGVFSANPSGLSFVSTITGEINLAASIPGTYTLTNSIIAGGGCASDFATSQVTVNPLPIVGFTGLAATYYYNDPSVNLVGSPSGGAFSGTAVSGNTFNPAVAGGGTFPVSYSYTDGNGCSNSSSQTTTVLAQPAPPSICEVTVDDAGVYNQIYWDKTQYTKVDSFIVYRETGNGYQRIGALADSALSLFVDTVRYLYFPNTGDPNAGTYRYKLQILDSAGHYSPLSPFHNTIYFNKTSGTFTWNAYQIEGQPVPLPATTLITYDLWRDDHSNGNWHIVNSVTGSQYTQTDVGWSLILDTAASWRVMTNWTIGCTPTRANIDVSRSNIRHGGHNLTTDVNEVKLDESVSIYPNPANDKVMIEISDLRLQSSNIKLYNVIGETLYQAQTNASNMIIDVSSFAKGIYTISIENSGKKVFKKLVIN